MYTKISAGRCNCRDMVPCRVSLSDERAVCAFDDDEIVVAQSCASPRAREPKEDNAFWIVGLKHQRSTQIRISQPFHGDVSPTGSASALAGRVLHTEHAPGGAGPSYASQCREVALLPTAL